MATISRLEVGQTVWERHRQRLGKIDFYSIIIKEIDPDGQWVIASWNNNPSRKYFAHSVSKWLVHKPM